MAIPYELSLALRYLRPKRTFVSVITLISVIGVTLGVAVLIIVISVMSGFDRDLREKILGFNAHLWVYQDGFSLSDYKGVREKILHQAHIQGAAPYVMGPLLIRTESESEQAQMQAPFVKGIDPNLEKTVSNLHTNLIAGKFDVSGNGILVGAVLAYKMGLRVGDRVAIFSPPSLERMMKSRGKADEVYEPPDDYEVRGVFDVGYYQFNSQFIVTSLRNAQTLYGLENSVHGLMVVLDDPFKAPEVRAELQKKLGRGYRIGIWTEENRDILDALLVEKSVMFYILFFIMIVAAFGIMNSLITFVVQKTNEIGMLKALGATRLQVVGLFLGQSFIVGFLGVVIGFGLGMLALHYRNPFLHSLRKLTGIEIFPASIYGFDVLPALIVPSDIAWICGSALVICTLAGMLPAWVAGRLQPVEALRHE